MKTPDEEVAKRIVDRFLKSKLLSETGCAKLMDGLATGALKAEDWKLVFELHAPAVEKGNGPKNQ